MTPEVRISRLSFTMAVHEVVIPWSLKWKWFILYKRLSVGHGCLLTKMLWIKVNDDLWGFDLEWHSRSLFTSTMVKIACSVLSPVIGGSMLATVHLHLITLMINNIDLVACDVHPSNSWASCISLVQWLGNLISAFWYKSDFSFYVFHVCIA